MQEKSNSSIVRAKLSLFRGCVNQAFNQLWSRPDPARSYTAYLIMFHQIVRASVPLMEATRRRAAELAESDAVCAALVGYLEQHIKEEQDHDLWILDDLTALGVPRNEVLALTPSSRVATFVGAQYYWALHHHPVALLGYIAVLEVPSPLAFIDSLQERTGLPTEAFRTARVHAQLDPGHVDDLDDLLDALPLSPLHHEILGVSLVHGSSSLEGCVREILPDVVSS